MIEPIYNLVYEFAGPFFIGAIIAQIVLFIFAFKWITRKGNKIIRSIVFFAMAFVVIAVIVSSVYEIARDLDTGTHPAQKVLEFHREYGYKQGYKKGFEDGKEWWRTH